MHSRWMPSQQTAHESPWWDAWDAHSSCFSQIIHFAQVNPKMPQTPSRALHIGMDKGSASHLLTHLGNALLSMGSHPLSCSSSPISKSSSSFLGGKKLPAEVLMGKGPGWGEGGETAAVTHGRQTWQHCVFPAPAGVLWWGQAYLASAGGIINPC